MHALPEGQDKVDAVKILVTNDDGDSFGLRMLLKAAKKFGDAYAIVPNRQRSAVSGALTLHKPIRIHKRDSDIYEINGTPSDCVLFSIFSGEFKKPDLILSGINWGDNSGVGTLLGSGTVAACWQAALETTPSIAFSMVKGKGDWRSKESWGDEKAVVERVVEIVHELKPSLGKMKFFNVNMPHGSGGKIVYPKHMQKERFNTQIVKRVDPEGRPYFWISGAQRKIDKGTDVEEVLVKGNTVITEVSLKIFGVE